MAMGRWSVGIFLGRVLVVLSFAGVLAAQNEVRNHAAFNLAQTSPFLSAETGIQYSVWQEPAPQEPQPQEPKKEEGDNPASVVVDKTRDATIQAAQTTKDAGTAALKKVREWESGWIAGGYIGKNRRLVPMTAQQRKDLYLRQTFTTASPYLKRLFAAGIDQARGVPREWGGGWGGYSKRFASREGQFFASNSITAYANAKLGYEPRYDQCKCSGFGPRLRHAMLRNFVTYNSTEREHRPQLALYLGSFGGGLISTAWKPHPRNAFAEGGRAVLGQAGYGVALNVFTEFAKDIDRKIWGRRR